MRVLQLISSGGFFGAENVMLQLTSELNKSAYIDPVAGVIKNQYNPHIEVVEKCKTRGIEAVSFPCNGKFDMKTISRIRQFIQKKEFDIIHSHGYKSNIYSYLATRGLSKALVATCHNWLGNDSKMIFYAILDRLVLRRFHKIVAVSDTVKKKILDSGIHSEKVRIVKNGISLEDFNSFVSVKELKASLGLSEYSIVIGTVGRISEEKGHRNLLAVAKYITEKHPGTVFLIIGDGPLRKELQREFNSPSIIFTGMRTDVLELYRCMNIFVLPSLTEGLPMVLLEAMASKLPVVATNVGAIPTVIESAKNGLLVTPGDREVLKNALLYLLENQDIAGKIGDFGYRTVKEHFSSDRMTRDYIGIYNEMIQ